MTKKGKKIGPPEAKEVEPIAPEDIGFTFTEHWIRQEQIDNAFASGTLDEMQPPLKAGEAPSGA